MSSPRRFFVSVKQFMYGYKTNKSLLSRAGQEVTKPEPASGTVLASPLFARMSELTRAMSEHCEMSEPPFTDECGERTKEFASKIHVLNIHEFLSVICYIMDDPALPELHDMLSPHFDKNDPDEKPWNFTAAAYKTYFEEYWPVGDYCCDRWCKTVYQ